MSIVTRHIAANPFVRQFFIFSLIGTLGFIVDAGTLHLAMSFAGLGYFSGRLVSYLCAATATWALNRHFTFRHGPRQGRVTQWTRFLIVNTGGGAINYGLYSLLILTSPFFREWPVLAVAFGSIAGLIVNFTASKYLVFKS